MFYQGYVIYAHVKADAEYTLNDDGTLRQYSDCTDNGEIEYYTATQRDIGKTLVGATIAELKAKIDATIIPQPPAHAHGNTYYRSLYLREADKVATLQNAVDQFANRVIIAETELAIVRDQLAAIRTGREL